MPDNIYLDNAATTAPHPEVIQTMTECMQSNYANPSSLHKMGQQAEKMVIASRKTVAEKLGCRPDELVFTSGGTEANNLALLGSLLPLRESSPQKTILCSAIEHPSVLNVFKYLATRGYDVVYLPVDDRGRVTAEILESHIDDTVKLVSIMMVNNELGCINDIAGLSKIVSRHQALFHVDAVQALGKTTVNLATPGVDLLSISGHKIHGPKGIGALYIKKGTKVGSIFQGSSQEKGYRPGTENTFAIAGLSTAAELLAGSSDRDILHTHRAYLIDALTSGISNISIRGIDPEEQVPHILNLSISGIKAEILVHSLASKNIYISTGAACSSRQTKKINHIHQALGMDHKQSESSIRISLTTTTTRPELEVFIKEIVPEVARLRKILNIK